MTAPNILTPEMRRLEKFAEIMMPGDAEAPILAPTVRAALSEWMTEIRAGEELAAVGVKPRSSALLFGPPGCGKTTFAHHFAARLGLPLANVNAEQLIGKYLGDSARSVAEFFDLIAPLDGKIAILFDEIDSIVSTRISDNGADKERTAALNVILRRVETFKGIFIGATNRADVIDPAMWRRFGMQIAIELPGPDEVFAILRRYLSPFDVPDEDVDILVKLTIGASPALLRMLAEGVKRSIVLDRRMKRAPTVSEVFRRVATSVAPPPEYPDKPGLWSDPMAFNAIEHISWPWLIPSKDDLDRRAAE